MNDAWDDLPAYERPGAGERGRGEDDGIAWGVPGQVPGAQPGCVPIFRAPWNGSPLIGIWISQSLQPVRVHWDSHATWPCGGSSRRCFWCAHGRVARLVSYGGALVRGTTWGLFELTQEATRSNLAWTNAGAGLRGRQVTLRRVESGIYKRVVATTSDQIVPLPDGITLPPAPDVRALLRAIWGV